MKIMWLREQGKKCTQHKPLSIIDYISNTMIGTIMNLFPTLYFVANSFSREYLEGNFITFKELFTKPFRIFFREQAKQFITVVQHEAVI